MTALLRSHLGKLRLVSQKIAGSNLRSPIDVVRWMTAVQAQDFNAAKWAIGLRCPGSTHHDAEQALASGKIVRSWPMCGTLHFLAAEDLSWILKLTSARIVNAAKAMHAARGLTKAVIERDEALGELALRYFRSHGPATIHDFATWSSLTIADSKIGAAVARAQLAETQVDEKAYFLDPNVLDANLTETDATYALASFDEFLLGYRDRDAVITKDRMKRVVPGANGVFAPILVRKGIVIGSWKRVIEKGAMTVTAYPFAALTSRESADFKKAMRAYGKFFAMPVRMSADAGLAGARSQR